ncbi:reverse transcriptase domain-containing protein [Tanacetum coccineum]
MASKFLSKYFPPSMVTKLRNDISNFRQLPDESLFEACERYKLLIDRCPNHNMLPVTQIDTFYNGLTLRHRDMINAAAGGTFMIRRPEDSITSSSSELAALTQQMADIRKDMLQMYRSNQQVNFMTPRCKTCGGPHSYYECQAAGGYTQDVYATTGTYNSGGNTHQPQDLKVITTRNGMTLAEPLVPPPALSSSEEVERDPETIMDQVLTESTIRVPPPVVQPSPIYRSSELPPVPASSSVIPEKNPHQPPMSYPSSLNKEKLQDKSDKQIHNFLQMFKKLHFNISFLEALAYMPKYAKMVKDHLTNKEKLLELVNTPLNENCVAILLKKLTEKLRDTRIFLIPLPLSVWKKLILPELTLTRMTLELATRTVAYPAGIAEDVFMKVGKSTFPAYFVVVDYDIDPRVPIILGRPFLRTAHALVDVHGEELTLRVGDEKLVFNVERTSKYPQNHGDESVHMIDILDTTCEDHFHEVLNIQKSINPLSGSPTPSSDPVVESLSSSFTPFEDSDFLLEETDAFLSLDDSIPPGIDNGIYDSEGGILFLEELLNDDPTPDLPPPLPVFEINETEKIKTSIEDPPDLELKDLPPHLEYAFLEGTSKLPVIIAKDLKREEKE